MTSHTRGLIRDFFPNLKTGILLYLRRAYYNKEIVCFEDIMERFGKSKTYISTIIKSLGCMELVQKIKLPQRAENGALLNIEITTQGLDIANTLLMEWLTDAELKKLTVVLEKFEKNKLISGYMQEIF